MAVDDPQARRAGDAPRYTEADFNRFREQLTDQNRIAMISGELARLRGTVEAMPAQMEAVARRVFSEQWSQQQTEARKQSDERLANRFRTFDLVFAAGQFLIAAAVVLGFAGKIP